MAYRRTQAEAEGEVFSCVEEGSVVRAWRVTKDTVVNTCGDRTPLLSWDGRNTIQQGYYGYVGAKAGDWIVEKAKGPIGDDGAPKHGYAYEAYTDYYFHLYFTKVEVTEEKPSIVEELKSLDGVVDRALDAISLAELRSVLLDFQYDLQKLIDKLSKEEGSG